MTLVLIGVWAFFRRVRNSPRNADLFKMTLGPVKAALEDAGLKKHEVHEIVLVGGSTRIPKIQKLLKDAKPKTGGREEVEDVKNSATMGWS